MRGGEYYIDDTVEFTSVDAGDDFSPLTVSAYKNEKVVLKQSVSIPSDILKDAPSDIKSKIIDTEARDKIKYANLYELGVKDLGKITRRGYGITSVANPQGELYVNGKRGIIARYPNSGYINDLSLIRI